jgi:hypothetical protein
MTQPIMPQRQPLPKQLTAAIKNCTSLERLVQLCQAHQAVLNPIHIAAIITKLPKLDAAGSGTADMGWSLSAISPQQLLLQQLLQQLLSQLKAQSQLSLPGSGSHSPRGVANTVWALAKLQCAPDAELRAVLLDSFCEQLHSAVPQDISNVLWGVAKLTKERAPVLCTAASSTQQPAAAAGGLGSSAAAGDAAAEAAGTAGPLLTQAQVQLLLQHLCQQLHNASVQTISNSLWAVVVLQQEYQWCMCNSLTDVQTLLSAFCAQPQQALPGHIQPIIRWADLDFQKQGINRVQKPLSSTACGSRHVVCTGTLLMWIAAARPAIIARVPAACLESIHSPDMYVCASYCASGMCRLLSV